MARREHPYAAFLGRVNKPAQYLGGEPGQITTAWDSVDGHVCLAFPDLYEIGMSHLGYKILYSELNAHPRLLAERAYTIWGDMEQELRTRGEPLRSLESWRPLSDFDVVGFSLQFELTFSNLLNMLELGGIALRTNDRDEDAPLILAGGPVATHAESISPFIDAFLIGDGERKAAEIALAWVDAKRAGVDRRERLRQLARLGGVYVPSLYDVEQDERTGLFVVQRPEDESLPYPVKRVIVPDLAAHPFPHDGPTAATETIFDRVSVEVARGCTEGCRFCQAGMIYRPVRERPPESILDTLERAVDFGGYDEAALTSLSTADYSALAPLVHEASKRLGKRRVSLSVSSLRAYGLSDEVLDDMRKERTSGLTFAPEAGSQRMRDVVNKNVTDAQLMQTAERVFSRGWGRMKLYFMIGLPTEEEPDVRGIVDTGARARAVGDAQLGKGRAKVVVSVSTFVPKPHTPFQWCAMNSREQVLEKQGWLADEARLTRMRLRMHESQGSWLEGILARGDRRLADVVEGAFRRGARFDSWDEEMKLEVWEAAFEEAGVDPEPFLRTLPVDARLPWDHIDVGLKEGFLAREYRRAVGGKLSPPCGKPIGGHVHPTNVEDALAQEKPLVCYHCGVECDLSEMREERLVALRSLSAERPRPAPVVAEGTTDKPKKPERRRPPERVAQGTPARLRLRFGKLGRLAYSGHLDLVRLFPRVLRRAGMPLFFSQGFHPKPQLTFTPALRLGIPSLSEYVDVKLRAAEIPEGGDEAKLLARLASQSTEDLPILEARLLGPQDPAISRVSELAEWLLELPSERLAQLDLEDAEALRARLTERRVEDPHVTRRGKRGERRLRIADGLVDLSVEPLADAPAEAGFASSGLGLRIWTRLMGSVILRPDDIARAFLGDDAADCRVVRVGVCADGEERLTPMQLDALRRRRALERAQARTP
ncbi:MAG: TIGR03960 family B12-binding radical SAM protein [Deltaproteobacteria bacterium]|nr:TIGR03960 family B12-binding radical SAM protein [Deltaproteobacteria bacterium]